MELISGDHQPIGDLQLTEWKENSFGAGAINGVAKVDFYNGQYRQVNMEEQRKMKSKWFPLV